MNRWLTNKELGILLFFGVALATVAAIVAWQQSQQRVSPAELLPPVAAVEVPVPPEHPPAPRDEPENTAPPAAQPAGADFAEPATAALTPATTTPQAPSAKLQVAVQGAVMRPGMYEADGGERVNDLLRMAGGPTERADLSDINRAAKLIDGTTLTVPETPASAAQDGVMRLKKSASAAIVNPPAYTISGWRPEQAAIPASTSPIAGTPAPAVPSAPEAATALINLNTASQAELETLPGIGPKTAEKIIAYRQTSPFVSVEDLMNVSGIGEKKLEAVRALVTAP